jgi:hypothetical protein
MMKRILLALAILIAATLGARAQTSVFVVGPVVPGNCVKFVSTTGLADAGSTCSSGGGGTPGGVNGSIQYNNSGSFGGSTSLTWVSPTLTIGLAGSTTGQLALAPAGSGSGTVTIQNPSTTAGFNFNLPTTAGSSGQPLLSGGGGSTAMSFGTLGIVGGGTNCSTASGTCIDNISGWSSIGYVFRSFGGVYTFSNVIPVSSGGTNLANGTSGGVLAFTGSSTIVSSGLLAQYGIVVGGGAGAAPATLANGTPGQILVAQTANPAWTTVSGSLTVNSAGVTTISASAVSNSMLANAAAYTFKGNATGSSAAPTDFTPGSLTNKASPAGGDYIVIADNASSGALKYATVSSIASAGSVGSVNGLTGAVSVTGGAGITVTPSAPNIAVAIKDGYVSSTTCTITDQSGASLSITTNYCTVSVTNNTVTVLAQITYPTTGTGAYATISLPVAVPNRSTFCGSFSWNGTSLATGGIPCAIKNTSTAQLFTSSGTAQTNAGVSGGVYSFTLSYPAL